MYFLEVERGQKRNVDGRWEGSREKRGCQHRPSHLICVSLKGATNHPAPTFATVRPTLLARPSSVMLDPRSPRPVKARKSESGDALGLCGCEWPACE